MLKYREALYAGESAMELQTLNIDHTGVVRILIVDDHENIHHDIIKILVPEDPTSDSRAAFSRATGQSSSKSQDMNFSITSATQGEEGLAIARKAVSENAPFAVAIVDMRMPPGWDGLETIEKIWSVSPDTQIMLCTAYSDYTWKEMVTRLGWTDSFLILKKPFDIMELKQNAVALARKWQLQRSNERHIQALEKARLDAEAGLIAKSDFLAIMSHEFRTPLGAITGCLQYIRRINPELGPNGDRVLESAFAASGGLMRILDDILDYIRMDKGNLSFTTAPFNLRTLLQDTITYYQSILNTDDIHFNLSFPKDCPEKITGDERRLRQVITHLISNAIKYSKSGEVTIAVEFGSEETDGSGTWAITIQDQGEGIPQEKLEEIFESFKQVENPLVRRQGGIGLGLAICRQIVLGMGGEITVSSEPGKGSRFKVEFSGPTGHAS